MANKILNSGDLEKLLGYLNFSEGRPDANFQRTLADTYAALAACGGDHPWRRWRQALHTRLDELQSDNVAAFRDSRQAESVLAVVFDIVLPAYRAHHADLLFHLSDAELLQPYFVARVIETVLALGPQSDDRERLAADAIKQLNDYVGHRPVAVLENRPKGEPYDHERVRPVPLYLAGAGVAPGPYSGIIETALEILQGTKAEILADACFDQAQMEELAFDPRAYDHGHPVNRRPNYVFGEWDPHVIDTKGRYRRLVLRKLTLDAVLARVHDSDLPQEQSLDEAGAVLAGVILMATGVSGSGPETHDSSVTLATLVPRIAKYRDAFYTSLLEKMTGPHAVRLRREAEIVRQPFGAARQHLNQFLARHRASQLQQRHLALLMAELGYPQASRRQASRIPAASVRTLSEIHIRLSAGHELAEGNRLEPAARQLIEIEDLLHRGIGCGAIVDPWNILGFGGLFPLFQAMEDSVRDTRIDELTAIVEQTFNLYARLLAEAAAAGGRDLCDRLVAGMHKLAAWWDRFATAEVSDVRPVFGGESAAAAEHVATALRTWHERGRTSADLAFWRDHLEGFQSIKAYALVVDVLLRKEDYHAAMGLLMHWLSQLDLVELEDGEHSFHTLALRWMLGYCQKLQAETEPASTDRRATPSAQTVVKFFDFFEANAQDYWRVPQLEILGIPLEDPDAAELLEDEESDEQEQLFEAAYEGMIYEDSTDDDVDMDVLEVGPETEFDLEVEGERIERHLRLLMTVSRLWIIAARLAFSSADRSAQNAKPSGAETTGEKQSPPLLPPDSWLAQAKENYYDLLALLDSIYEYPIPQPSGAYDSVVEYDRRRVIKDRLLHVILGTSLSNWLALAALRGRKGRPRKRTNWKAELVLLEDAMWNGETAQVQEIIPSFLQAFQGEPLLFTPLGQGGAPRQILRASRAQALLATLAANLPRLGLIGHTFLVVQTAHEIERSQQLHGPRVTEFARIFQSGLQAAAEAVVDAAKNEADDDALLHLLERMVLPYLPVWREHSKTLRVATLELIGNETEWTGLREFVGRYGGDLFHARFMTFGNLRGILHQGTGAYLRYLEDNPDPLHPVRLADDLDQVVSRAQAERYLEIVLHAVIENYEVYRDYNATATQSDYGENLYILLDFLRLKAEYDRQAWYFRPLAHVHEVLARGRPNAAAAWQDKFTRAAQPIAKRFLKRLDQLESMHGLRLNTIRDRLQERFVQPLTLDRLCALVEPTINAAGTPAAAKALERFEKQLRPCAETPTGVGLDVPPWLQRLAATVHQVKTSKTAVAELAENLLQISRRDTPLAEMETQLIKPPSGVSQHDLWPAIIAAVGKVAGD